MRPKRREDVITEETKNYKSGQIETTATVGTWMINQIRVLSLKNAISAGFFIPDFQIS